MQTELSKRERRIIELLSSSMISTRKEILRAMERRARGRWLTLEEAEAKADNSADLAAIKDFQLATKNAVNDEVLIHYMRQSELEYRLGLIPKEYESLELDLYSLCVEFGVVDKKPFEEFKMDINRLTSLQIVASYSPRYAYSLTEQELIMETQIALTQEGARLAQSLGLIGTDQQLRPL